MTPDPSVTQALLVAATAVLEHRTHPVAFDAHGVPALAPALDAGRLVQTPDGVGFVDPLDLEQSLVDTVVQQTADAWPDLDAVHQVLARLEAIGYTLDLSRPLWPELYRALDARHGLNLLDVLKAAAEAPLVEDPIADRAHPLVWTLYPPLADALPELNPAPALLAATLSPVLDAIEGDMMGGMLHEGVRRLAATDSALAVRLADAFAADPDRASVQLVANALLGLADHDGPDAHRRALGLSRATPVGLRRAGIAALGWLGGNEERLKVTLVRFDEIAADPLDAAVDFPVLAQGLGAIADTTDAAPSSIAAQQRLVRLARDHTDAVRYVSARIAARTAANTPTAPWLRDLLDAIASPTSDKATLRWIDHSLLHLLKMDALWVVEYFRQFAEHRADSPEGMTLPESLEMVSSKLLTEHRPLLSAEITRWLASGRPRLQAAACDLVGHGHVPQDGTTPFRLDAGVLSQLDEPALERTLYALLGHLADGRHLAPLLVSIVWGPWASPSVCALATSALVTGALYDYPGSASRHLVRLAVRTDTPPLAWSVVSEALAQSNAYFGALSDRDRLKELDAPTHRLRRYHALEQDQHRDMRKQAHAESQVMSLFTTIPLKHGRSWFSETDGVIEAPREMGTIRHEVEVSRSLRLDPLGHLMNKHFWRHCAARA